jgi:hypothetical protein
VQHNSLSDRALASEPDDIFHRQESAAPVRALPAPASSSRLVVEAYHSAGSRADSAASTVASTGSNSLMPQAATIRATTG